MFTRYNKNNKDIERIIKTPKKIIKSQNKLYNIKKNKQIDDFILYENINEEQAFFIPMMLEIHLIFKNLSKLNQTESKSLIIYIKDVIDVLYEPIISKFKDTEMNKLSNPYNFIIRCFQNLNNQIVNNPLDISKSRVSFELFIMILNESLNLYKNYINLKVKKNELLGEIITKNIDIIKSKKYYYHKFLDQIKIKNFKYYLIKINKILDRILKNYTNDVNLNYIYIEGYLKMLKDYGVIPKIISQFKAISLFSTFNIISALSNIDLKKNSVNNPIFYHFIKELREYRVNRISLIELFYFIAFEYYGNNYEIIDGEIFYSLICDIFFCCKKSGNSLISSMNNKYFKIFDKNKK